MITGIHHINFLVRDLEAGIERYESTLGIAKFKRDELTQRGVRTARVKLGNTWLILVQPLTNDSVPGKHLAKFGEGFFLLSLETDDLESEIVRIEDNGGELSGPMRYGLDDWEVQDLSLNQFFGAQIQLTSERTKSNK